MRAPTFVFALALAVATPNLARAQAQGDTARRLFDAERWPEAAVALREVVQSQAPPGDKELAQFRLAIALYRMGLKQPAYAFFSEISDKPNHIKFAETLLWLAKLSDELPEPADVMERVGKYDDTHVARFNNPAQREVHWRLSYLLGRYNERNARFDEAIAELGRVDRASPLYGKAQMLTGIDYVRTRRAVPAAQAFQRVIAWLDEGRREGDGHLRGLANLSLARTYYSAAIQNDENGALVVDQTRLSASVKYYRRVDVAGEYFLDSLFEDSWVRYMAGDYAHALGNLRVLSSVGMPPRYAEGAVLEAVILFTTCRYDEAAAAVAKMQQTYAPRRQEIERAIAAVDKMDEPARVAFVRAAHGAVGDALSDRSFASYLAYDTFLEAEQKRFAEAPATFRSAKIGDDVKDDYTLAREIVQKQLGDLARERLQRASDELGQHLRDALKISFDITAAQKNELGVVASSSPDVSLPAPKPAKLSWPLNGETASVDPWGYRVPITSKCGR